MKLSEIVEDADLLVPNAFTREQKIRMANQAQRQLFRDYPLNSTVFTFSVKAGVDTYSIPANCLQENIADVLVNGQNYPFTTPGSSKGYQIVNDKLILAPSPYQDMTGKIYYKAALPDLTVNEWNDTPDFPEDYHELLVLGIANRIAERTQDYKQAAELDGRFRRLAIEALTKMTKPKAKRTRISRGWL